MRYFFTLVTAGAFFCFPFGSAAQKTLAVVGSSTSACSGASVVDSCYIGRLRLYFNKTAPNDTTIDNGYAVPGYNPYRGMPSSYVPPYPWANLQPDPAHNITKALSIHPDIVLVNYPTNAYDSLRIDSILYCLRTIRDSANKAGVPCFVTTTQPRSAAPFNTGAARLKLAILKDSILQEFGYFAIDFYTGLFNPADSSILYDAGDQIHMNDIGHDSLFQRVLRKNVFLAALPATFLQFATLNKNNVNIVQWLTAKETDVVYYEIQRSSDGRSFSAIGTVNALNSAGNNQYQYTDQQPLTGLSYYKIVIVDRDGKKHASPIMTARSNAGKAGIVRVFAGNASQVAVTIQSTEIKNVSLQLLNNMGTVIGIYNRKLEAGINTFYLQTPLLSNGVYHLRANAAGESMVSSFIKN